MTLKIWELKLKILRNTWRYTLFRGDITDLPPSPPPLLTLKGRGYFTNEKDGGGAIMAPPIISARINGMRLVFSGY